MSDPEKTPFTHEEGVMAGRIIIWTVIIAVCFGIFAVVIYSFYPALLGIEREAFQKSHQYVEARNTALFTYYDEYTNLGTQIAQLKADTNQDHATEISAMNMQRAALLSRIRNEARKLPDGEVPSEITSLLNPEH
ncbi:hypothetical protein A2239_02415 [Candidatus Uhrbacteria bacterium RIFOXYA2_FULL_40_9]|nr:MAG: hypothetical protein UT94_C0031G0023 [Candidatus Uhrbacteria bacterium GW2011_GWF2_40_263]OGL93919.1 MAG: hypothetical protein A2239_02415 [Candidatus Uhrbacteria bacterium RIFOXYA2_FULL_40_9]OGL97590.1 MAG: hypothetical protein A2332_01085 [Candidatus Uhrbacteria bacterium RIFOXYB2_FULL_41_18]HBK35258.1 hypothetical protein [Candidatus Uhrbacteria bacterium]HCB56109.1 hypothetical protein [Candidatus Uhrbacteria bacterium]